MTDAKPKQTTEVDHGVGSRIALLRTASGLSQSALASSVGVSFQQLQKYEAGKNRVGASRLHAIADRLGVPVASFFGEAEPESAAPSGPGLLRIAGAMELLRAYDAIADAQMRRDILALAKSAARVSQAGAAPVPAERTRDLGAGVAAPAAG